jgi:protein-S-isoprenylcysteine O-methyltransferase Ste14
MDLDHGPIYNSNIMIKLYVFIVLSIGLIVWSWKSLGNRRAHGFYRFFAFEAIQALIIINIDNWFNNPFSVTQIISWILLFGSIIVAIQGFYLLHTMGRPAQGIEATTKLVKTGIYKYIRHPLYSSLIFLAWGSFLKNISLLSLGLVCLAAIFSITAAIIEERENIQRFGDEYTHYINSTKRFIPFIV